MRLTGTHSWLGIGVAALAISVSASAEPSKKHTLTTPAELETYVWAPTPAELHEKVREAEEAGWVAVGRPVFGCVSEAGGFAWKQRVVRLWPDAGQLPIRPRPPVQPRPKPAPLPVPGTGPKPAPLPLVPPTAVPTSE